MHDWTKVGIVTEIFQLE